MVLRAVRLVFVAITTSPFRCHVCQVLGVRPKEEALLGVAARRVVAVVEDFHTVGDWSVRKFPCEAVSSDPPAPPATEPDPSVSIIVGGFGPFEATVGLTFETSSETLCNREDREDRREDGKQVEDRE